MEQELRDQFKKLVYGFFRDNKMNATDMADLLKANFEFYATEHAKEGKSWLDMRKKLSQESIDDFDKMWHEFVQKSIDYVRNHEDVKQLIAAERDELAEEWNKNLSGDYKMIPDLRLSFGVDGLDESIEAGKWTAATDSGICLSVGSRDLIQMM